NLPNRPVTSICKNQDFWNTILAETDQPLIACKFLLRMSAFHPKRTVRVAPGASRLATSR
ncbi:MAG: hypothetical protein ACLPSW_06690, partial [Roseiarcus sp.]